MEYDWVREQLCRGCWHYKRCGRIRTFLCHVARTVRVMCMRRKRRQVNENKPAFSAQKKEKPQKTCSGCKHLDMNNDGSVYCMKNLEHPCIDNGGEPYKFWEAST